MRKIAISLLVLALVAAFSATGVVSAATCAATTTTTCPATTSAQCTSCTTSACCCCPCVCPTVTCCPAVACCVVTKCCAVSAAPAPAAKEVKTAVMAKDGSAAASHGSQASATTQGIIQSNTIGDVTINVSGDKNDVGGIIIIQKNDAENKATTNQAMNSFNPIVTKTWTKTTTIDVDTTVNIDSYNEFTMTPPDGTPP